VKRRTIQLSPWGTVSVVFLVVYLCLATLVKFSAPFSVDRAARDFFQGIQEITAGSVIRGWVIFGDWRVLTVMLILVSLALSRGIKRDFVLFFLVALGGGGALGHLSKVVVGRLRPGDPRFGFPSGHTLAAIVTVIGLLYFAYRGGLLRRPLGVAGSATGGAFIVLGVGISRMYTDSHWLTDVVGGILLGGAVATGAARAIERRQSVHRSQFMVHGAETGDPQSPSLNLEPSNIARTGINPEP
jgi:membrane-associated phospholipid phosphatase